MAKKIKQEQIIQTDIWQNSIESTKELIRFIDSLDAGLKRTSKTAESIFKGGQKFSYEGIKETTKEVDKLNESFEAKIKLDEERVKLEKELTKLQKKVSDELEKYNKVVGDNVDAFEKLNKETKEAEKQAKSLAAQFGKNDERTKEAIKNYQKLEKELKDINKTIKDSNKESAKRLQIEEKLANATSQEAKELAELSLRLQEQNKANKELAKESLGLIDVYDKQSKRLIKLRKEYKSVVIEQGKGSKEAKRLAKEVKKLDKQLKEVDESAGQFQRNVGNYPDTLGAAASSILGIASAAGVASGALSAAQSGLEATEEGGGAMAELGAEISAIWNTTTNTIAQAVLDAKDWATQAGENYAAGQDLTDAMYNAADGTGRLASETQSLTDKYQLQRSLRKSLVRSERLYAKQIRETEEQIESLNGKIDIQQAIAGDSTRSFNELARAVRNSQELQAERAEKNITIARKELDLVQKRIFIQEQLSGDDGVAPALLEEETQAIIKLQAARNDAAKEQIENEIELRQIRQDRLERDLDILIDGYDNQKTINERIIADDKKTLAERQRLLEETIAKGNKSLEGQVAVLKRLTRNKVDFEELLTLDATDLNKRIRSLGFSEIIEGRILEVVRERKTVIQDIAEATDDLNDAKNETLDLERKIANQTNRLTGGSEEDFEEQNFENQKESLRRRIKQLEEGSLEQLRLVAEYNELLLGAQKEYEDKEAERLEKANDARNKALEEQRQKEIEEDKAYQKWLDDQAEKQRQKEIENREKTLSTLEALNNKYFDDRRAKVEEEIAAVEEREGRLQELANQGNDDAAASLAENQKQQAEANRKKEELIKKEQQFQTALAIIKAYSAELDNGKSTPEAFASAITSVSVLTSFVSSLPSFYEGTEDTGTVSNPLDVNGGRLAVLHDNERVMTAEQNKKIGDYSNDEVADVMYSLDRGLIMPNVDLNQRRFESNNELIKRVETMEKSIVSAIENKETYLGSDIDTLKGLIYQTYKKNGSKTTIKSKAKIW